MKQDSVLETGEMAKALVIKPGDLSFDLQQSRKKLCVVVVNL